MPIKAHLETRSPATDNRRHPRRALRLETRGTLPDGIAANVVVHNISVAGLLIETELSLAVGETLAIDLPDAGPVGAEIVWESGNLFGCAFQQALGEAALAAAQLRADPAAGEQPNLPQTAKSLGVGESFGIRLNRLRREKSLTLAQVASALGVSKPTVWAWEKGKARPIPERIEAIASILGVPASELLQNPDQVQAIEVIDDCRLRIATVYGTAPQNIRIMVEL